MVEGSHHQTSPGWDILYFFDFLSFFPNFFFCQDREDYVTGESNVWVSRYACSIFAINVTTQKAWFLSSLAVFFVLVVVFVHILELPVFFFFQTQFVILLVYGTYNIQTNCVEDFFPLVFLYVH